MLFRSAAAPGGGAWMRMTPLTGQGDWTYFVGDTTDNGVSDEVVRLSPNVIMRTDAIGAGSLFVATARRHEARFVIRVRYEDVAEIPDGDWASMSYEIQDDGYHRTVKWRFFNYESSYQLAVTDSWDGSPGWMTIDDPEEWHTIVATLRIPDWGAGSTFQIGDGNGESLAYASSLAVDPTIDDGVRIRFQVGSAGPTCYVDLSESYIEVRAI